MAQHGDVGPSDLNAWKFPVSMKGVVSIDKKVVLLENERDEWELPGGKLEPHEHPAACVVREIREELGLAVSADKILDCWIYNVLGKVEVLIVTYACTVRAAPQIAISNEHKAVGLFSEDEVDDLRMPSGYKDSIREYFRLVRSESVPSATTPD